MHHHLYPSEDTYITNRSGYGDKNFGIDELLQIGTDSQNVRVRKTTRDFSYNLVVWDNHCVTDFTGVFDGDLNIVTTENSLGTISGSFVGSASYFTGNMTGSYDGYIDGLPENNASYGGPLVGFSGSLSASAIDGNLSGSLIVESAIGYGGDLTGSAGHLTGIATGTDTLNYNYWVTETTKYADRTLIKFNLDFISESIADGTIVDPEFKLRLKVCNEYELPIGYSIYAFPISQSWVMGNGYFSDGGSDTGVSWYYKDYNGGTEWTSPVTTSIRPIVDFLNDENNATASFNYGGGTWYYNSSSLQDFYYQSSDISMDVTDIVMSWINEELPNNGFILMSSDEIQATGSGFVLTFFGRDTNSINSPYLDVMWDDWAFETETSSTGSVVITSSYSGMDVTIQNNSTFEIEGGMVGTFTSSLLMLTKVNHLTASNESITGDVFEFTGSFTGSFSTDLAEGLGYVDMNAIFTSSYFSGSIDGGADFEYNDAEVSSSNVIGLISGSFISASITYFEGELTASKATLVATNVNGYYLDTLNYFVHGFINGIGINGQIAGLPVFGPYRGTVTIESSSVEGPCGNTFGAYGFTASFTGGIFDGVSFTSYLVDGKLENAILSGAWSPNTLIGSKILIPLPSGIEPYAYAYVYGTYIYGTALGTYEISESIDTGIGWESASFSGQFIDGPLLGGYLNVQLSGSVFTSSYSHTSSVEIVTSGLSSLDTNRPFTVIVKNLKPEYKGGDLPRINIFARREFPLKTFEKATQQTEYLVPNYLPTSSYYAIKDNMSEEIIIDFDNYTRISCDINGNYFLLDTTGLAQERPYKILVRVESSGSKYTFDDRNVFKVIR